MSLRLTVLGFAAFLLFAPATLPVVPEIGSSAVLAAEMDSAAKEALDDQTPPARLDKRTIRKRVKALRAAMKSGNLAPEERRQVRQKIKAYRGELKSRRGAATGDQSTGKQRKKRKGAMEEEQTTKPEMKQQAPAEENKQVPPAGETKKQETAPEEGKMPESQGEGQGGGMTPKSDTTEKQMATVSESDCSNLWASANKNGDDVLTDEEANPFVEALKASGNTGSGPTIKKSDFMNACTKGAFKNVSP
jgi:hypothetical protein